MKQIFSLAVFLCFALGVTAQKNIKQNVLVKDADGKTVVNETINLRFTVLAKTGGRRVYQETHLGASTDSNGIAIANLGEGIAKLNSFSNIAWEHDDYSLIVEADSNQDGTFEILGRSTFKDEENEEKDSGNDPSEKRSMNGPESIAMGVNTTASGSKATAMGNTTTAEGNSSTSMGNSTYAQAASSTAMGELTQALGIGSTAMGRNSIASGNASTAMGNFTTASGSFSTAIGYGTQALSHGEIAVGTFNEPYTPNDPVAFDEDDQLFVIGNGTLIVPSNALTVLKNGTITAPSLDVSKITSAKSLVTKEFLDFKYTLEAINEGNGLGWRLGGLSSANYGNVGSTAVDLSFSSMTSFTRGATGRSSIATGSGTTASGEQSSAMGWETIASGNSATAMGRLSTASGSFSTSMGLETRAPSYGETVVGTFNTVYTPSNSQAFNSNDRIFVVGNGTNDFSRKNAMTILKNGDIGIVTDSPQAKVHISSGADTGLGTNNGYVMLGESTGANISLDNNEIMAKNNGNAADLNLQIEGGRVLIGGNVGIGTTDPQELLHVDGIFRIGTETIEDIGTNLLAFDANLLPTANGGLDLGTSSFRWRTVYATNGTINTSDRREKKNIKGLTYGLDEVLQMQPVSFNWKNTNNPDLKLGLIAQDLQSLIPEVVKSHTLETNEATGDLSKKEAERLGVYYSDLVPVLIKAIQEQQEIIDSQNTKIEDIEGKLDMLLKLYEEEAKFSDGTLNNIVK